MSTEETILNQVESFSGKITINDVPRILSGNYLPDNVRRTEDVMRLAKFTSTSNLTKVELRKIVWELVHADRVIIGPRGILRVGSKESIPATVAASASNRVSDYSDAAVRKRNELRERDAAMILERLAKGSVSEDANTDLILEDPDVIRALFMGANALRNCAQDQQAIAEEEPTAKVKPAKQWSPEKDAELLKAYLSRCPLEELAQRYGAGKSILTTRLVNLLGKDLIDQNRSADSNDQTTDSESGSVNSKLRSVRTGQRWTKDEVRSLSDDYAAGLSVQALAASHERSEHSIRCRLVLLGIGGLSRGLTRE